MTKYCCNPHFTDERTEVGMNLVRDEVRGLRDGAPARPAGEATCAGSLRPPPPDQAPTPQPRVGPVGNEAWLCLSQLLKKTQSHRCATRQVQLNVHPRTGTVAAGVVLGRLFERLPRFENSQHKMSGRKHAQSPSHQMPLLHSSSPPFPPCLPPGICFMRSKWQE